jgi:DNA sulfur modification protein DndD
MELETERLAARQELAAVVDPLERLRQSVEHAEEDLRERGGDFAGQRQGLVLERGRLEQRTSEIRTELRDLAAGPLPLSLVRPHLDSIISRVSEQAQIGDPQALAIWLATRDQRVIREMRQIGLDDQSLQAIEDLLAADRALACEPTDSGGPREVPRPCVDRIRTLISGVLDAAVAHARRLVDELETSTLRLNEVERLLTAMPSEEDLAGMVAHLQRAEEGYRNKQREHDAREAQLQAADRGLEIVKARYDREWKSSRSEQLGQGDLTRFLRHTDKAQGIIRAFRTRLVARHSQRLEELILEGYHLLLRKDGLIREINIDPDTCKIELRGRHDQVLDLDRLSAGERQLLATAMLWGLARAAGRPLPVIIDTPLARLDSAHKTHFVQRYLPQASHQVLVLSTDSEIHGEYYDGVKFAISREYMLEHDDATGSTQVVPGYFQKETAHAT